jgi:sugar lactone lactonase YvrE
MRNHLVVLLGSTFVALGATACSSDDSAGGSTTSAGGSAGSTSATTGSGGSTTTTTTGSGGTGGAGMSDASDDGTGGGSNDGSTDGSSAFRPSLLADLGDSCNTPDGMRKDPKSNDIILSCPNFFGKTADGGAFLAAPALMKITPANKVEPYFTDLPAPPDAPNRAGPMGIDFGPDGNLYVADHQYRYSTMYKSRILRINVDANGKPTSADVVVEGLRLSNAVMWNKDYLYLTDTWAYDDPPEGGKSAIYRFSKAELMAANSTNTIKIQKPTATTADPHMFTTFTTVPGRGVNLAGADGITFDAAGNLYSGKFGDGIISKITFDAMGNKAMQVEFANDPVMTCADGIFFDALSSNIYVTDSRNNAIRVVSPAGAVSTLWENADTNGEGGLLDQPAEPTIRGNELLIANFDAGFTPAQMAKNAASDAPHTLSVIKLK